MRAEGSDVRGTPWAVPLTPESWFLTPRSWTRLDVLYPRPAPEIRMKVVLALLLAAPLALRRTGSDAGRRGG